MNISGSFTCASTKKLSGQFALAYKRALETQPDQTFTVGIRFNFLDSNTKLQTLKMLAAFEHIHASSSHCNVLIKWTSPENDADIAELGMIAQETSSLPFAFQTA